MPSSVDDALVFGGKLRVAVAAGTLGLGGGTYLGSQVYPFRSALLVGALVGLVALAAAISVRS
jgi:hypothetical protein